MTPMDLVDVVEIVQVRLRCQWYLESRISLLKQIETTAMMTAQMVGIAG